MDVGRRRVDRTRHHWLSLVVASSILWPAVISAQDLTGALVGTVRDEQGGAIAGAQVSVSSPAMIGGVLRQRTDDKGHLRFTTLPPGIYVLDVEFPGFVTAHEEQIRIEIGSTIDRPIVLKVTKFQASMDVVGSSIEARDPGFATRFGLAALRSIPTRRAGMLDPVRTAPGISATSPSSGTVNTFSALGSGTNENMFLVDGTNTTCPCNGVARAEIGVDFIHEVQIQSIGASAEFGNMQGAVVNIVTKSGSNRLLYDASYYGQPVQLTSHPVRLAVPSPGSGLTSYERIRYRDFTSGVGGPLVRDRVWLFAGYQYLRDYDSQPGADPAHPRAFEQNKVFGKLTWQPAPGWVLDHSVHTEFWVNPDRPTISLPFEVTTRPHATVPAVTFAHLSHTTGSNTVWDLRGGRFVYDSQSPPSTGITNAVSHTDSVTGITSGGPSQFGALKLSRATVKATASHYWSGLWGADHALKVGTQIERGQHQSPSVIPTGVRYSDSNGKPSQAIASAPSNTGGLFMTTALFVSDAVTLGNRATIDAGLRFDHDAAISQDLHAIDLDGRETSTVIRGAGTLYVWNILSPRLGVTVNLSDDGRTILRASYGRYSQGVLTGEIAPFHPGATPIITTKFDSATGAYDLPVSVVDASNLQLNPKIRAPHSDEYSIGADRQVGRQVSMAVAYVRKSGADFIGWTDIGGIYHQELRTVAGVTVPVFVLDNGTSAQRFLLTNPAGYSLTYDGLVMTVEKRRSHGWQASGSYTFSRVSGLQPSSGSTASGAQVSTIAPPPGGGLTFGQDPNNLTNAGGRLPNDRPHMIHGSGAVDLLWTGLVLAANLQYTSGKPWAASGVTSVPQNTQERILLEPRGTRRLSSQTILDFRLSKTIAFNRASRVELVLDVLNALGSTAEESLVTDNLASANFGKANVWVDPRRVMLGARFNFGR